MTTRNAHHHDVIPRKRTLRTASVAATILMATVLSLIPGCEQPAEPLRIAVNPWPGYAFLFLAEERGYFQDEGVDVRLVEFMSLADVRRTFEVGKADLMTVTLVESLLAGKYSHREPRVISILDYSLGGDVLVARKEIATLSDLSGARVTMEPGTLDVVNVFNALKKAGLQTAEIVAVSASQGEMPGMFDRGEVDAVQCYPPVSNQLLDREDTHVLFDSGEVPRSIADVLVADAETIRSRRSDLRGVIRAYERALDFYRTSPDEAVAIMARRTGMTVDEFRDGIAGVELIDPGRQFEHLSDPTLLPQSLRLTLQALREMRLLNPDADAAELIESSLAREVSET